MLLRIGQEVQKVPRSTRFILKGLVTMPARVLNNKTVQHKKLDSRYIFLGLVLLSCFLFLFRLGFFPFKDYDEAVYALVTAEGWEKGEFLKLFRGNSPWIDKPPGLFWVMWSSVAVFGFNEFALRLPVALMGMATLLLTYLLAMHVSRRDKRIALVAVLCLLTLGEFVYSAREVRLDIPVTFAIMLAVYGFVRGLEKSVWYLLFGVSLGMGMLFKSVIAFLAIPLILVVAAFYRRWDFMRSFYFYFSIFIFLGLTLPWHIYQIMYVDSNFLYKYFWPHVNRYGSTIQGDGNSYFLYYLRYLLQFAQPWILVFFCAIFATFTHLLNDKSIKRLVRYLGSWVLFILLLFSFSSTKLFPYIDPIYPMAAIVIASFLVCFYDEHQRYHMILKSSFIILVCVGLISTTIQIFEIGENGLRFGEYTLARDEKAIAEILKYQSFSRELMTSNFYSWDTIVYYVYPEKIVLKKLSDPNSKGNYFLVMPTDILEFADLHPSLASRAKQVFQGKKLTMFQVGN